MEAGDAEDMGCVWGYAAGNSSEYLSNGEIMLMRSGTGYTLVVETLNVVMLTFPLVSCVCRGVSPVYCQIITLSLPSDYRLLLHCLHAGAYGYLHIN